MVASSFFGLGSRPGRGGRGAVPGAMSGCRTQGPRSLAAFTVAANSAAIGAGMLPCQARSISWTRTVSAARRSRSNFECFVIVPRTGVAPELGAVR